MDDSYDRLSDGLRDSLGNRVRRRVRERRLTGGEPVPLLRTPSAAPCGLRPEAGLRSEGGLRPEAGLRSEGGLCLPDGWLFALLVPVERDRRPALLMLRDQAGDLSDALGGGLLDEIAVDGRPTHRCWLYLDEARCARQQSRNRRLERLASALGWTRKRPADWLGPALITGRDLYWADRDVPSVVVRAALTTS